MPIEFQSSPHYTAQLLEDKKVKKVAIIDNIYDPRSVSEFSGDEISLFWAEIDVSDTGAKEELSALIREALKREIHRAKDIDDDVLQLLWDRREQMRELKGPVNDILFPTILGEIKRLEDFAGHLERELNLEVIRENSNVEVEKLEGVPIVFIDYVLGPEQHRNESVENAVRIAEKIYSTYSGAKMPLIVLMSNYQDAA
jgi:hypothetical protein